MRCQVTPYEGSHPHIFVSYCHKDAEQVYPLLEQMSRDGYRIWYDDGNQAGDDWLENIAQHLNNSTMCLAMISENSSRSHNCKSEINEAIAWGKKLVAVLLEDFQMPLGMRLQLSTIHYLKRPEYPSDWLLLQKLYEAESMVACKASDNTTSRPIVMTKDPEPENTPTDSVVPEPPSIPLGSDIPKQPEKNGTALALITSEQVDPPEKPKVPQQSAEPSYQVLLQLSKQQGWRFSTLPVRIGRSSKRCNVVVRDNAYIGNCHVEIGLEDQAFYLQDMNSSNGTYIGEQKLPSGGRIPLTNESEFRLYNESFLFLSGDIAHILAMRGYIWTLINVATKEIYPILQEQVLLDRGHKWKYGTLNDKKISRHQHAVITFQDEKLWLEDLGTQNGTFLNGQRICSQERHPLSEKNQICLGDTVLEVGMITLQGETE